MDELRKLIHDWRTDADFYSDMDALHLWNDCARSHARSLEQAIEGGENVHDVLELWKSDLSKYAGHENMLTWNRVSAVHIEQLRCVLDHV